MSMLKGNKDLARKLKKLSGKAGSSIARKSVGMGARVIRDEAKRNVPVASGNLKKAIKVKIRKFKNKRGFHGYIVVDKGRKARFDGWYAHFVEYGVQPHEIKPKNKQVLQVGSGVAQVVNHPGHAAQPFMRPAFDTKKEAAVKKIGDVMWDLIKKEAMKK